MIQNIQQSHFLLYKNQLNETKEEANMSWKLFGQIVLLIAIAIAMLITVRCVQRKMCMKKLASAKSVTVATQNFTPAK